MLTKDFLDQMDKATKELLDITKNEFFSQDIEILNTRPSQDKWSISECFQHLNLTLDIYIPQMERVVNEKANYPKAEKHFSHSIIGKMAVKTMQPKPDKSIGFKIKTFKKLNPEKSDVNSEEVINKFLSFQNSTLEIIQELKYISLSKPKIVTTVGPILKMRIGDALNFMIAHNQRHILQAQNVFKIIQ